MDAQGRLGGWIASGGASIVRSVRYGGAAVGGLARFRLAVGGNPDRACDSV